MPRLGAPMAVLEFRISKGEEDGYEEDGIIVHDVAEVTSFEGGA